MTAVVASFARRRVGRQPWVVTLAAGTFVIVFGRVGPDWPAQEFRTWLARNVGLRAWNDAWYAGHALPGYSVLFPPFAKVLGAGLTGLAAATVCAWAVGKLTTSTVHVLPRNAAIAVNTSVAVGVLGDLIIGQVPFLLGVAAGLLALLAVRDHHSYVALLLAGACSLASPLAGLFLLLVGVAWLPEIGWRRSLPFSAAGLGDLVALTLGGSSGTFPFEITRGVGVGTFVALATVLIPRDLATLRRFVFLNGIAAIALASVPNAVGGNVARLSQLICVPLALWVAGVDGARRWRVPLLRPAMFAASVIAALVWQTIPVVSAIARSAGDPSTSSGYYAGLLSFLSTQSSSTGRLEIPFTREHWEAADVAPHFPIARGWERQLDVEYNEVLYHPLTPASYRAWLDASAVDLVALPKAPLDYGGVAERTLLAHPPAYLSMVYQDKNWTVFRVRDATPLLTGADATLTHLGTSSFTVQFRAPGTATIKLHASDLWRTNTSTACLSSNPDGWLHLRTTRPGAVTVKAQVSAETVLGHSASACDDDGDG